MKTPTSLPLLALLATFSLTATAAVRLNTIGYPPDTPKRASVDGPASDFTVLRVTDGAEVLHGRTEPWPGDTETGPARSTADFSAVTESGDYRLRVDGGGESPPFSVAADVYQDAFRTVTRGMYLWRCGTAVSGEHGGEVFAHGPCHTNDALLDLVGMTGGRKPAAGGWHDAGDYNKYVVNAGVTVGAMLRAWEDFGPVIRGIDLGLPESGMPLPDFLAEVKWELDWLLTMQADDGRVYHKLSTREFGPMIPPDREATDRFFAPWSSAATASFTAMMAQATRHFRPYDAAYADRCLAAARRSYACLVAHPENVRADLSAFRTGAYATRDEDDRLWAAAELWETTGEPGALADVEARLQKAGARVDADFDWGSVGNLGVFTYLASAREGRDAALVGQLRENLLAVADGIVRTGAAQPDARPLGNRYYWGCNGSVARQSLILHAAYRVTPKPEYRTTALDALNYLFGRNPYGRSFVTGLGHEPPRHPHDRRSAGDDVEAPWPGYLVGGPHPQATDWKDEEADYRTNEIAINWNAALIYALAAFLDGASDLATRIQMPAKEPDVIFVPTPQVVVDRMLELAEIKPGDVVYDLGCGDGRFVVTAAKRFGVRALGVDIDPDRVREALANVRTNHVEHLVTIRQADVFTLDLREANVVMLYLLPRLNVQLMPQLAQLRPGSRILSHDFDMRGAKPLLVEEMVLEDAALDDPDYEIAEHTIYKWVVPWEPEPAGEPD